MRPCPPTFPPVLSPGFRILALGLIGFFAIVSGLWVFSLGHHAKMMWKIAYCRSSTPPSQASTDPGKDSQTGWWSDYWALTGLGTRDESIYGASMIPCHCPGPSSLYTAQGWFLGNSLSHYGAERSWRGRESTGALRDGFSFLMLVGFGLIAKHWLVWISGEPRWQRECFRPLQGCLLIILESEHDY